MVIQNYIAEQIEKHQKANSEFRENLVFFFACKNQFYEQFAKSSSYDQKRQLLRFIARTFYIEDGKVDISLRPPFNWMKKVAQKGDFYNWRERRGSATHSVCFLNPFIRYHFINVLKKTAPIVKKCSTGAIFFPRRDLGVARSSLS